MLENVRYWMDQHESLRKIIPALRNTIFMRMRLKHIEEKRQKKDRFVFSEHKSEINRVMSMLEDDLSRETFKNVITYRATGDLSYLQGCVVYPQYFQPDIFRPVENEVFVDGGAYTGDTIDDFVHKFMRGGGTLPTGKRYMRGNLIRAIALP